MPSEIRQEDDTAGASVRVSNRIAARSQQQQQEQEEEEGPPPSNNAATTTVPACNDVNAAFEVDQHTPAPSDNSSDDASDDSSDDGFKGMKKEGAKKELYAKLQIWSIL